jgi:hypothetical protein
MRLAPRSLSLLLSALSFCSAGTGALAQDPDPWDRQVSLDIRDGRLSEAFNRIALEAKIKVEVSPDARSLVSTTKLTSRMDGVPAKVGMESLLRVVVGPKGERLKARFEKDRCIIELAEAKPAPQPGGPADRSPDSQPISFAGSEVTVLRAVTGLLDTVKTGYRIHPDVRRAMRAKRVTVKFENIPLRTALNMAIADLSLGDNRLDIWFEQERGYYVFIPQPLVPARDVSDVRVKFRSRDEPADMALKQLFDDAGLDYAFSRGDVGDKPITLSVNDTPTKAIETILKAAGLNDELMATEFGGVFAFRPHRFTQIEPDMERRITARFKNADIRYALKALFGPYNYTIDQNVVGTVTAELNDVPLREALKRVLSRASGPLSLTYRVAAGVFNVAPNPNYEVWK